MDENSVQKNENPEPSSADHTTLLVSEGPFAGWKMARKGFDAYETLVGPYYYKFNEDGARTAFVPEARHLNSSGAVHGGALMSFADFSLFLIAHRELREVHAVTMTCNCEFLSAGTLEGWIEGQGEVLRDARSMVFVRGVLRQNGRMVLAYSGALKKVGPRS